MNRFEFIGAIPLLGLWVPRLTAHDDDDVADPANQTQAQALRVLLGRGQAQKLDAQTFLFEGRRYRGSFSAADSGEIVSVVSLEQYLYSVVAREMPHSWPAAALQTQAIVARTYVLQRSNPVRQYDLVPSQADQVYTGMDAEKPETTAAVDATAGQVLRFGGGFAQALYSSCCGGHTESSADAWGGTPLPYLSGVPCAYCRTSPWYTWSQKIPLARVQTALASDLQPIGDVARVSLDSPDASGRSRFWTFEGSRNSQRVKAASVRSKLGTRTVPSLRIARLTLDAPALPQTERAVTIEGGGLGHGVGLCQWGARGMALAGAGVQSILSYYYPGTGTGND